MIISETMFGLGIAGYLCIIILGFVCLFIGLAKEKEWIGLMGVFAVGSGLVLIFVIFNHTQINKEYREALQIIETCPSEIDSHYELVVEGKLSEDTGPVKYTIYKNDSGDLGIVISRSGENREINVYIASDNKVQNLLTRLEYHRKHDGGFSCW